MSKVVIKVSTMDPDMQEFAIECASESILSKNTEQEIAGSIRETFDSRYPATWHVLVGRNFGCYVTHEKSKFIYFYLGQVGICMYATA